MLVVVRKSVLDEPEITDDPPMPEATINAGDEIPEISVMMVFTSNADEGVRDIHALSDLSIAEANFVYRASGIRARLKLVHAFAHGYKEDSSKTFRLI